MNIFEVIFIFIYIFSRFYSRCIIAVIFHGLKQGSKTQIHRGATFGRKMSLQATVLNRNGSAGRNKEKYTIFSKKFSNIKHYLSFNDEN